MVTELHKNELEENEAIASILISGNTNGDIYEIGWSDSDKTKKSLIDYPSSFLSISSLKYILPVPFKTNYFFYPYL